MKQGTVKNILSLNFKEGEKVQVSPVGEVVGYDGRNFSVDGEVILQSILKNGLDIPLDVNHSFDSAAGWFEQNSFEVREDGIYASLELNEQGKPLVDGRLFRYLSPVFDLDKNRKVIGLDSVGLVNRPNLLNNALNQKGDGVDKSEEQEKIENLEKQVEDYKTENGELKTKLEAYEANDKRKESNAKDGEIEELKTQIKEMNTKFDNVSQKLSVFQKEDLEPNSSQSGELSDAEKQAASMLGMSEDEYKGAK